MNARSGVLFDVGVISDMCVDLVISGNVRPQFHQVEQIVDDYWLELGGSANIFACQMAKLGAKVAVIGKLGQDQFGEFALRRLAEAQVDTALVQVETSLQTGLSVALAEPSDRAILTFPGGIAAVGPDDLPKCPGGLYRHWHVASIFLLTRLRASWREFLETAKNEGLTTSFDPNWDPENRWEGLRELLPFIDVLLPNGAEAAALTGESDAITAGKMLAQSGPLVVVKCGAEGAYAIKRDQVWQFGPDSFGSEKVSVIDTVGAGDNFDAGFLRAWMLGSDIDECLRLGHACAVASLRASGGIQGQLVAALASKT